MDKQTQPWSALDFGIGELEEIYPDPFIEDDQDWLEVTGFILALSLIHNDLEDLTFYSKLLDDHLPEKFGEVGVQQGQYSGMKTYLLRFHFGVLFSLLDLIQDTKNNDGVLEISVFKKLIAQLPKPAKNTWQMLKAVALKQKSSDPIFGILAKVRNNVAFHYNPKILLRAYKKRISDTSVKEKFRRCYISRGAKIKNLRYFFSDAAAQSAATIVLNKDFDETKVIIGRIIDEASLLIYHMVNTFIMLRGAAYRDV